MPLAIITRHDSLFTEQRLSVAFILQHVFLRVATITQQKVAVCRIDGDNGVTAMLHSGGDIALENFSSLVGQCIDYFANAVFYCHKLYNYNFYWSLLE